MSVKIGGKQGLGGEVVEGIIIAGWGTCQHLGQREQKLSQSQPRMTLVTPDQLETFNMSFTRQKMVTRFPCLHIHRIGTQFLVMNQTMISIRIYHD